MSDSSPAPSDEPVSIGSFRAIWDALLNKPFAHFPRVQDSNGRWTSLPDKDAIAAVAGGLTALAPENELDAALDRARESLDEVKGLTDYQDGKATRLLTIITFLSALSGVLFARLAESYPLHVAIGRAGTGWWSTSLVVASYLAFAAFVLLAICGALVTFHAIRTRFRYPDTRQPGRNKSYLFYRSILEVSPDQWASSFLSAGDRTKLTPDLKLRYFRNYVVESYLVAAKVADKLRYLEPAQALQHLAIRVLLIWLVLYALTLAMVPPVEKSSGLGGSQAVAPAPAAAPSAVTVNPVPSASERR
jgi:hypothetical protein